MNTAEKQIMNLAKAALINSYGITEPQAHTFIIKTAMDLRRGKIDIAQEIIAGSAKPNRVG